ncbi:PLP-dependent aminotransferase family protein [Chitinimonas sp.]|uniref:aminotransferase-like domain-containing protein n=1 Tax=Chitinimonas sp. TaxID=1934313 RepID=UPI002F953DB3
MRHLATDLAAVSAAPPRYQQLADLLSARIQSGTLPAGAQLPAIRQLCAAHQASLATVTHALHRLEAAGLITARPRQGFFVSAGASRPAQAATLGELQPIALQGHRRLLMELATTQANCLSLGHLRMDDRLLPTAALKRLLQQHLRQDAEVLTRGSGYGNATVREQIARRARQFGCDFDPEGIILTNGESEAVELCLRQLTRPGDVIAVPSPGPMRTLECIASLGLQILEVPADPDHGLSLPALAFALQHHPVAACVVEANYASPTGSLMSDADKAALLALLQQHNIPLIEFDAFGDLHHGHERPRPIKAFDRHDNVLYCSGMACLSSPGFSIGYIATGRHRITLRTARIVHGELIPGIVEETLASFMISGQFDQHLRRLRRHLAQQLTALRMAVLRHFPAGSRVSQSEGGYLLWVAVPGINTTELLHAARKAGYTFIPGRVFSLGNAFDHCLRLTAGYPLDAKREQGIRTLGELARQLQKPVS